VRISRKVRVAGLTLVLAARAAGVAACCAAARIAVPPRARITSRHDRSARPLPDRADRVAITGRAAIASEKLRPW